MPFNYILPLRGSTNVGSISDDERCRREKILKATIEHYLPEFAKRIAESVLDNADESVVVIPITTFAPNMDRDDYIMMGMAVKYAALFGVRILTVPQ
jgi:hypothetical protein